MNSEKILADDVKRGEKPGSGLPFWATEILRICAKVEKAKKSDQSFSQ